MTKGRTPHTLLIGYLLIYGAAIMLAVVITHNVAVAGVHVVLLTLGAIALRMILPSLEDTRL